MQPRTLLGAGVLAGAGVLITSAVLAQDKKTATRPEAAEPGGQQPAADAESQIEVWARYAMPAKQHKLLQRMAGSWDTTTRYRMTPDTPVVESKGTCQRKWILGSRFLLEEFDGGSIVFPFCGIGLYGYDCFEQKYTSAWADTTSTAIMTNMGTYDEPNAVVDFTGEYGNPWTGIKNKSRGRTRFISKNEHALELYIQHVDGREFKTLEIVYTRKAPKQGASSDPATAGGAKPEKQPAGADQAEMIFPDREWVRCAPEDQGMDPGPIEQMGPLMKAAQANGVLIRNGYLVAEWTFAGPPEKKLEVQSVSKSITSLVLGLALDEQLIPSLDARVKEYYPALTVGPYTEQVTFRHLVTMTSGIAPGWSHFQLDPPLMPPGIEHHYHNDQFAALAQALTYVFKRELKEVLAERVLEVIGARMDWGRDGAVETAGGGRVPVDAGYAFTHWTARDLARVGHLYLNGGKWKGEQVLSSSYVRDSWTAISFKINEYHKEQRAEQDAHKRAARAKELSKYRYGLGWWTQEGCDGWSMHGNGGQFCLVLPEYNVVMTKVNSYQVKPFVRDTAFYPLIMKSLKRE